MKTALNKNHRQTKSDGRLMISSKLKPLNSQRQNVLPSPLKVTKLNFNKFNKNRLEIQTTRIAREETNHSAVYKLEILNHKSFDKRGHGRTASYEEIKSEIKRDLPKNLEPIEKVA